MGTEGRDHFSYPRWWVCDGPAPNRGDSGWDGCGLMASGMVLVDDGGGVKKGGKGGVPRGRDLARARSPGAHRPSMHPSPWCLPAASEVAPSCPPPQAPHGHPIPMPASRGTLRVPRSRSSWKRLSSTAHSWYVPPRGDWLGPCGQPKSCPVGTLPHETVGPGGKGTVVQGDRGWAPGPRGPPSQEGLGSSGPDTTRVFCLSVSPAPCLHLSSHLRRRHSVQGC